VPVAAPTPTLSPEVELSVLDGDPGSKAEFSQILDQVQAGVGSCNPEPDRQTAASTIWASWDQGGKSGTLLEWARALVTACGG
jgi:hypothetical protein